MSTSKQFKLSKRIRLAGKIFGYNTAFSMFGGGKLGQGAFGTVYSSKDAAVKVAHSKGQKELKHETEMLEHLKGVKIAPQLLGSGTGYAAIQKFEGHVLKDSFVLKKIKEDSVFADYIFRRIVEAIGALHRKNIAQRDLHAGNIFITDDYQVKILDYGQAYRGYAIAFNEAFFGNDNDPTKGSIGLISHLFSQTQSYKTYKRILLNAIRIICKKKEVDFKIVVQKYESIEGNDTKESEYFDSLNKIGYNVENDYSDVPNFYSALDTALKINTKNPFKTKKVSPKNKLLSISSGITKSINKKHLFQGTIPQASEGGVFSGPESGYPIILHGTEAVIPLDEVNVPSARYIQGQAGIWELDFESILDHAVYFAGKSPFPKGAKQAEILDWLQDTLGLTWKEISDHREKILNKIRELTPDAWKSGNYPCLKIPRIDSNFEIEIGMRYNDQTQIYSPGEKFVDDQKEFLDQTMSNAEEALDETASDIMDMVDEFIKQDKERLNKFKEEENARLQQKLQEIRGENEEPEGLDDLLNDIREEDDEEDDDIEPEGLDDLLNDVINEPTTEISEDALDDLPEGIREALAKHVNKKTGRQTIPTKEKSAKRTGITNTKIYNFLSKGILEVQNKLNSIDSNIQHQNLLLQNIVDISFVTLQKVEEQDDILGRKIDALSDAFIKQNSIAKDLYDKQQLYRSESGLERIRKSAGTETPFDTRKNSSGKSGLGMISKIRKFFQTNVGKYLWKLIRGFLPKRLVNILGKINKVINLPSRIASKISSKILTSVTNRFAPKVATTATNRAVAKGWEHIALPGVSRTLNKTVDAPAAKALSTGADNILIKILQSRKVQELLIKKLGKEGAEKLTVKLAGKLIPGVATAYGLGEGLARMAMGDIKGGFLSFGSAIPIAGWGFAAVDILRDIDTEAYTRHIESNLGSITTGQGNEHIAAFFADALGVKEGDYEQGGLTKPGTAMLHGTEAVVPKNNIMPVDPIGGVLLAATSNYIQQAGPVANSIAPTINQAISPLAKIYGVPNVSVSAPIGGNISQLSSAMKDVKTKLSDDELTGVEKELLETKNADMFSEKLYKMIDPSGNFMDIIEKFKKKLLNFRNPFNPGSPGEVGAEPFVLLGGSQDPGQAGIDFTLKGTQNRAILAGQVVEIGHQYDPNSTGGDNRKGAGYGNYLVVRSINPVDGSQVDMLYAHFPDNEIKVKEGDQVSVGQDLGRMATQQEFADPKTRPSVGSGTGSHTSLDFFKPGSHQAHTGARALGDYILKELGKGPQGAIEKARQQAYQQQQATRQTPGPLPTAQGLGRQGILNNQDFGSSSGVGNKGYLIIPGHASGGGAPEEKTLVKKLAYNAYMNIKQKYPTVKVQYLDVDSMFDDSDAGWDKQKEWYKKKEAEGWEILEVHMDSSVESGQGKGRGAIVPTTELNSAEAYFAKNYGSYDRGHRDLAAPKRGVGLFELGNMSPELQQASRENKISKQQLDALTAPLERSVGQSQTINPPSTNRRYEEFQGTDKNADTKFLILHQPNAPVINGSVSSAFREDTAGTWVSKAELPSNIRQLYIQRLGRN